MNPLENTFITGQTDTLKTDHACQETQEPSNCLHVEEATSGHHVKPVGTLN